MTLPTLKHLRTIEAGLRASWPAWEPYGRKPWRLRYWEVDGYADVRSPAKGRTPYGWPYEFVSGADALAFKTMCMAKLDRLS